jgi:hypothetical protein
MVFISDNLKLLTTNLKLKPICGAKCYICEVVVPQSGGSKKNEE